MLPDFKQFDKITERMSSPSGLSKWFFLTLVLAFFAGWKIWDVIVWLLWR